MKPLLFQSFLQRIKDATKFSQLVQIDRELTGLANSEKPESIAFLKEEIELRSNPTVYTALIRLSNKSEAPLFEDSPSEDSEGLINDEDSEDLHIDVIGHLSGEDPLVSAKLGDDEHVDKMVEKFTSQLSSKPYDDTSDVNMDGLLSRPGFLEEIDLAEREEAGIFPGVRPPVAELLKKIYNTISPEDLAEVIADSKKDNASEDLSQAEKGMLNERIEERINILLSAQNNVHLIQRRRDARSMGISLNDLLEIKSGMAKKDMPLVFRSFLETLRDENKELAELIPAGPEGNGPSQADIDKLQARIYEKIHQKVQDKKVIEELLSGSIDPPQDPPAPKGPSR